MSVTKRSLSCSALQPLHDILTLLYCKAEFYIPSVLERRGTKSGESKTEAHKIVSRPASKAKHRRTTFKLTAFSPLSFPRPRLNPTTENIAPESEHYELSGGRNKKTNELQLLAHKQAEKMKHVDNILGEYLMDNFPKFWSTTVFASGGDEEEYPCYWNVTDVKALNHGIVSAPYLEFPITVYHFSEDEGNIHYSNTVDKRDFKVGTTVLMDRFMSTSSSSDIAEEETTTLIRIDLPAGFPAAVIRNCATCLAFKEQEVLLPFTLDNTGNSLTYGN
jgi:hypothetical protein